MLKSLIQKYSKTAGRRNEVDHITTVALLLQRMFGQQILDPGWTWKRNYIHQLLSLALFVYVFFGTLECIKTTKDAEVVAEACYTLIMIVVFPIKLILFINNRFLFRKLYVTAKTTLLDLILADTSQDIKTVLKTSRKIVYALFSMVLLPCSIYVISTLWHYFHGEKVLLSRSTLTLMPMNSPYFEIAWFLHTIFLFEISSTIILDMWFVLLIYFLCVSYNSLSKILVVPLKDGESKQIYAFRLHQALRTFYKYHVKQVGYMNQLSNMYKWLAFVPLCNAAMCICLILLLMSKEINWRFAPHLLPMFAEIFAYNWFGEQIKTKAHLLHQTLINFDWMNLRPNDRKSYYIIVTYMKKQFGIKTAIGNDLSLITMTAVLKVSYQAFTVLKTMEK